jgi:ketol-acid reductoisomerase
MNKVISDTAEYGCYLFDNAARPLLKDFMKKVDLDIVGKGLTLKDAHVGNQLLNKVNDEIRNHPVEIVGKKLRAYMTAMKAIVS